MEQNVYCFLICLKKLNFKWNFIEKELYDFSWNKEFKQFFSIEKSLVYFVNFFSVNELLKMKMKCMDFFKIWDDEDKLDFFEDIIIDNSQVFEMVNIYINILNGMMDVYGLIIFNNFNIIICWFMLIIIILMVFILVVFFYGMNIFLLLEGKFYVLLVIVVVLISFSLFVIWYF